jgi:DNA-binding transcriptional MerR regulator
VNKVTERYQIGEVAKIAGVAVDTLRFYEKEGLIQEPYRSEGGFRQYAPSVIDRVRFIKKAQSFGLTLAQIKTIMRKSDQGLKPCCSHVEKVLERKLVELEKSIRDLQKMKRNLKSLVKAWIPMEEAKKERYAVCPQIEVDRTVIKGEKRHVKKKR